MKEFQLAQINVAKAVAQMDTEMMFGFASRLEEINALADHALWWIPAGHIPTEEEGKAKLAHIREHGPSQSAFTFGQPYPKP